MPRPSNRGRLLDAAASVIVDEGPSALTYDRLAVVTGTSKGGLLYHFPTKASLLEDLLDTTLQAFEDRIDRAVDGSGPRGWARGYVDATFDLEVSRPDIVNAILLASADVGSDLIDRCTARMDDWGHRLRNCGLSPGLAATVRYACDGWWTLRAIGATREDDDGELLRAHLHHLLDGADVPPVPS